MLIHLLFKLDAEIYVCCFLLLLFLFQMHDERIRSEGEKKNDEDQIGRSNEPMTTFVN